MIGFVTLHRKLLEWEWYKDNNTKSLFIHLILKANHKDNYYQGALIKRGQLITGRKALSLELGISEQSIRTSINRLKSTSEITIESNNKNSLITILNYDLYQSKEASNHPANQQLTSNQPAINQQLTTNNNDNNEKNENNNINKAFVADANKDIKSFRKYLFDIVKEKEVSRDALFMKNKIDTSKRNELWESFIINAIQETPLIEDEKHAWNCFKKFVNDNSNKYRIKLDRNPV